ncbi:MAG: hypothetical protein JJ900_16045 [Rhodospirillales bacterium]|nr:hypothetical protein [Rhodospirillales bacterium]MBO6788360.1 hypothetical protein [Rhodospirillales bacterium]
MRRRRDRATGIASVGLSAVVALALLWPSSDQTAPPPDRAARAEAALELPDVAVQLPPPPAMAIQTPAPVIEADTATAAATIRREKAPSTPAPTPQAIDVNETAAPAPAEIARGRVLLRALEAGDGPRISIAWPKSVHDREALYLVMTRCLGMAHAVMTAEGQLFRDQDPPGTLWRPNADKYSGFVRSADDTILPRERQLKDRIRRRHGVQDGVLVRIFPRAVDAAILGGIHTGAGRHMDSSSNVQATYTLNGDDVSVSGITVGQFTSPRRFRVSGNCI